MTSQITLISSLVQREVQEKTASKVDKWYTIRRHRWIYIECL